MNPREIKEILNDIGAATKKSFGQHFLIDKKILSDIVAAAEIEKGECVLEVGPGLGVLTRELLGAGARVTAIEKDKKLAAFLNVQEYNGLEVVQGDAAKLDWNALVAKDWKLVSNLPYAITSLALRKALTANQPPKKIIVLIQKEVADRALGKEGKGSLLSLMVSLYAESGRIARRVKKNAFYPPPKVESAVLELVPYTESARKKKWGVDPERVMKLAKLGFSHPRKKLASNLKSEYPEIEPIFVKIGLSEGVRAEELIPEEWVHLTLLTVE